MARATFKVRWLTAYFAVIVAARLAVAVTEHQGAQGLVQTLLAATLAAGCLGVLYLFAWLNARAAIYTITTRRVVLRIGVALPMTWNLPFKRIASADMTVRKEGDGDIALQLAGKDRIGWLFLWPHVQPWHFVKARPTLRTIAEPARVSALLADAVAAWASREAAPVLVASRAHDASPSPGEAAVSAAAAAHATLATEAGH